MHTHHLSLTVLAAWLGSTLPLNATARAAGEPVPLPPAAVRPGVEAGPTRVSVAVWATDIVQIDSIGQTFNASLSR